MSVAEKAADLGYASGWRVVRALPERMAVAMFDAGADFAARRHGGPQQLRRNLARVLGVAPEDVPDDLIRDSLRSYARYWREAFRLPSMDLAATAAAVDSSVEGQAYLEQAMAAGKGAILALPHSGNWDMAGVVHPDVGWAVDGRRAAEAGVALPPFRGVSREPRDGDLSAQRRRTATLRGTRETIAREQGRVLARRAGSRGQGCAGHLLRGTDPHARGAGQARDRDRGRAAAGALLVHRRRLGLLDRSADRRLVRNRRRTQALADRFEVNIAAHPADWHMLQPLWLDDLSESRRARMESR